MFDGQKDDRIPAAVPAIGLHRRIGIEGVKTGKTQ